MRKIFSKQDIEKKKKKQQIAIGIFLIFVMISSTIGFAFFSGDSSNNNNQKKINYQGHDFIINENGLWQTNVQGQNVITKFNPAETESIITNFEANLQTIQGKPLYYMSNNENAVTEFLSNVGNYIQRYQQICLDGENCTGELITKDCSNNVVVFKESNETNSETIKIYKRENCLFIEAPYSEQVKGADRLIFKLIGIQE